MPPRKRHDPEQRPTPIDGGEITDDMTTGLDPNKHYVYVNPVPLAGQDQIGQYEAKGYEIQQYGPGAPRPLNVSKRVVDKGGDITSVGLVLMACPREEHEARQRRAAATVKAQEKIMLTKGGLDDGFRGGSLGIRASAGGIQQVNDRLGGDFENG